ncbi:pentatricopeptide repeat-containing protein [Prunus yedoensis var. nudiflora]|uniref:Pentatricopeptide repeat-containing protein n=1 Tax=Prunus yedoensis var. nudiflora TaxID=2094558 RepID=A0A314UPX1_PRUYE|nr:pentatricopeptide repeat-containing protein [Prunus yedoensis var. nudiflora]
MSRAGCVPDLESFDTVIGAMCTVRRTSEAVDMIKQMVEKVGLTPRQGTIAKWQQHCEQTEYMESS